MQILQSLVLVCRSLDVDNCLRSQHGYDDLWGNPLAPSTLGTGAHRRDRDSVDGMSELHAKFFERVPHRLFCSPLAPTLVSLLRNFPVRSWLSVANREADRSSYQGSPRPGGRPPIRAGIVCAATKSSKYPRMWKRSNEAHMSPTSSTSGCRRQDDLKQRVDWQHDERCDNVSGFRGQERIRMM